MTTLPGLKLSSGRVEGYKVSRVCDVIDRNRGEWKKDLLKNLVPETELKAIDAIPMPLICQT